MIRTHHAIAQSNLTDYGQMTLENSLGPCCKHFFPCTAADISAGTLTDVVGGVVIDPVAETDHSIGAGAAGTVRMQSFGTNCGITGTWSAPNGKDCLMVVAGKARIDSGSADVSDGGFITAYFGTATTTILRAQPYYATFYSDAVSDPGQIGLKTLATPFYSQNRIRTDGQDYIFAACMRGNQLEHYADGILTGTNNSRLALSALQTDWDTFSPGAEFRCSHGAYSQDVMVCQAATGTTNPLGIACTVGGVPQAIVRDNGDTEVPGGFLKIDGNAASTGEYPQDYYAIAWYVFENGAPTDIAEATAWMKAQWSAGNKVSWPGWVSLL